MAALCNLFLHNIILQKIFSEIRHEKYLNLTK